MMSFAEAIEDALAQAMAADERVVIVGEDVHMLRVNLFARFGKERVRAAPISESAFVGAAATATVGSTSKACGDGWHIFQGWPWWCPRLLPMPVPSCWRQSSMKARSSTSNTNY